MSTTTPFSPAEFNALDPYTQAVWREVYNERLTHYRRVTPYSYSYCGDMATRDADRAARTYNETGERVDFTPALDCPAHGAGCAAWAEIHDDETEGVDDVPNAPAPRPARRLADVGAALLAVGILAGCTAAPSTPAPEPTTTPAAVDVQLPMPEALPPAVTFALIAELNTPVWSRRRAKIRRPRLLLKSQRKSPAASSSASRSGTP